MTDLTHLASLQRFSYEELQFLGRRSNHNIYIHYRRTSALVGLVMMLVTYSSTQFLQGPDTTFFNDSLILLFCAIASTYLPCRCGKLPLLTAKGRSQVRQRMHPDYSKTNLQNAIVQLAAGEGVVYLAYLANCLWLIKLIEQIALIALFFMGTWSFMTHSFILPRPFQSNKYLSETEILKFSELNKPSAENCCPDLLLEFLVKTGNFDDAEKLSRTLIERAERG
jgi:hypothetical protein